MPTTRQGWSAPWFAVNLTILLACVLVLPFGSPTVSAVIALMFGAAFSEWTAGYYAGEGRRRWSWSLAIAVFTPVFYSDPGWWLLVAAGPMLLGHALNRALSAISWPMWLAVRITAYLAGAVVADLVLHHAGLDGHTARMVAGLAGAAAAVVYEAVMFTPQWGARRVLGMVLPWGLVRDSLLAYTAVVATYSWSVDRELVLASAPVVAAALVMMYFLDRAVARTRLLTAVAEAQVKASSKSTLDTAWMLGHAVDRLSGSHANVDMAVVGPRLKYYRITNGTPQLKARGASIWDHPWVKTLRDTPALLVRRGVEEHREYLFRIGNPGDTVFMFKLMTPKSSEFSRRVPESVLRSFLDDVNAWVSHGQATAPMSTTVDQVRASCAHLVSLLEYAGEYRPVREVLFELHRIEELVASALTGGSEVHTERVAQQEVPVGAWPDASW